MRKKKKLLDWADASVFDKKRCIIYIEHTEECYVFKQKANELLLFLQDRFREWQFVIVKNLYNKITPRPGSFEVSFSQNAKIEPELLWSGVNQGPPRADKFPKSWEDLIPRITALLKKIYVDPTKIVEINLEEEPKKQEEIEIEIIDDGS